MKSKWHILNLIESELELSKYEAKVLQFLDLGF